MAFQLSPGVQVTERDLTSVVPAVGTSIGGTAGTFVWGPANEVTDVTSENDLVKKFGRPPIATSQNREWFAAASFLAYTNTLKLVRALDTSSALNAGSTAGVLIENENAYVNASSFTNGMWAAKWAGAIGISLKVSFADSSSFGAATLTGTITSAIDSTTVTGSGTAFDNELVVGSILQDSTGATIGTVSAIASATSLTLAANAAVAVTGAAGKRGAWPYAAQFDYAPTTTAYVSANSGGSSDELHIIVIDEDGLFTGTAGTVLEKFTGVSKASDAYDSVGRSNYYKNVINDRSDYIWWTNHPAAVANNWGTLSAGVTYTSDATAPESIVSLTGGANGTTDNADLQTAYDLFANDELVDVNLIFTGPAPAAVSDYVIDNVAEVRKDCVVFISPSAASVLDNVGSEATDIVAELASYTRSSYAVMDSGWKYMYNRYYDTYSWIPCNGDVAGLCANTDNVADPWFSPAGYNRGAIKNALKLAYSPSKSDRDVLYKAGINPIVGFPGSGIVLFGDKTMLERPSAFDRINVRRLFITLEKSIATAAKFQLFEFNDAFTRAQFKNLVEPFLRDVQGRRGIYDFRVVCDGTNNDTQVVDSNQFVADIFIQPAKSINFIQLNFIATRTGISFEEVGG
jgi:hypothetical protein